MGKSIFSNNEKKFILGMGMVLGLRELSMTMLNPFISIFGKGLKGSTPFLCGLALGIYGLTNAIFQIPYGHLSDRYGRKPIILIGLMQIIIGMLISYKTNNIFSFIFSRALQGSGAVIAIAYSWMGDNIEDSKKNRAMGIAGTIVALGAVIAFGVGPLLYKVLSVPKMFLGCSMLISTSWLLIFFTIKEPGKNFKSQAVPENIINTEINHRTNTLMSNSITDNKSLLLISSLGFINNFVSSTMFFIAPPFLEKSIGADNMWYVFLPAILAGILVMRKFNKLADEGYFENTVKGALAMLIFGIILLATKNIYMVALGVLLILSGFMCLTSEIPSAVNKIYPQNIRGYANGVLQTFTFLGFFTGPTLSGLFTQYNIGILLYLLPVLLCILAEWVTRWITVDNHLM